jgi:hypothetical protein
MEKMWVQFLTEESTHIRTDYLCMRSVISSPLSPDTQPDTTVNTEPDHELSTTLNDAGFCASIFARQHDSFIFVSGLLL